MEKPAGANNHPSGQCPPDKNAFLQNTYQRYWQELCRYINKTFGAGPPEPEDVVQAAFTRFAALDNPQTMESPRAWLYVTARNIVLDEKRRALTRDAYAQDAVHQNDPADRNELSPERVTLSREHISILLRALRNIPPKRRRLLLLNRLDGMSLTDIGKQLGLSESAVRKQVRLAVAECLKAMESNESPDNGKRSQSP